MSKTIKRNYPSIQFQLKETLGEKQVIQSLSNYEVHCTITNQPIRNKEIEVIPIYIENLILVVHKDDKPNKQAPYH